MTGAETAGAEDARNLTQLRAMLPGGPWTGRAVSPLASHQGWAHKAQDCDTKLHIFLSSTYLLPLLIKVGVVVRRQVWIAG